MEKASLELERLQQEMQADIDRALVHPSARSCGGGNNVRRLAWLELFELEDGLRAHLDAAAHAMGLADDNKRVEALESLLALGEEDASPALELAPLQLFEDISCCPPSQ